MDVVAPLPAALAIPDAPFRAPPPAPLRRARHAAGALLLLGTAGCLGGNASFTVDAGVHLPSIDGSLGLSNTTLTDLDEIDLSSQLSLDDADVAPLPRAELDFGFLDLAAWGFTTEASGRGTATADFGDITAGSDVESELALSMVQLRVLGDVIDSGPFQLGVGLAAQWVDVQLDVHEVVFGLDESIDVQQAVPLLAARATFDLGALDLVPLSFELSAAGVKLSYADIDGALLDVEALVRWRFGLFGLFAGWRHLLVQIDGEASGQAFDGDVTLSGVVAGLTLRF